MSWTAPHDGVDEFLTPQIAPAQEDSIINRPLKLIARELSSN
jgi:hypothetical protein